MTESLSSSDVVMTSQHLSTLLDIRGSRVRSSPSRRELTATCVSRDAIWQLSCRPQTKFAGGEYCFRLCILITQSEMRILLTPVVVTMNVRLEPIIDDPAGTQDLLYLLLAAALLLLALRFMKRAVAPIGALIEAVAAAASVAFAVGAALVLVVATAVSR
jgi:hypothetical protein